MTQIFHEVRFRQCFGPSGSCCLHISLLSGPVALNQSDLHSAPHNVQGGVTMTVRIFICESAYEQLSSNRWVSSDSVV